MGSQNLFVMLENCRKKVISRSELNELILYSGKIALIFLKKRYPGYIPRIIRLNYEPADIAIDAIVPLFSCTKDDAGIYLSKVLNSWNTPIENELDAKYFLHKIIWESMEQHISKFLKETDPVFAKILASFHYHIEKLGLSKISCFGVSYIVKDKGSVMYSRLIDPDTFDSLPDELFYGSKDCMLRDLLRYIRENTSFCAAVPLNALIMRIKNLNEQELSFRAKSSNQVNIEDSIIFREIVESAFQQSVRKLEEIYHKSEKLDSAEIETIEMVLKDILKDIEQTGSTGGLFEYFNRYMPGVSRQDFYKKYHQVLDHSVRILKRNLKAGFQD